ncbi:MAG: deoxyribose-phosphate aldolase [Spirochaetales bacterium]|nr:deoxyribose-phosphate aldolase [Spirochaetales bacterium]
MNYESLSKMIDHSLLHPTMTDEILRKECGVAVKYNVASVCIKPYAIPLALEELKGSDVLVGTVIGFPHGNSSTDIKVIEARAAAAAGAGEVDMVINIGKALGGDWNFVQQEIKAVNDAVVKNGSILKVIFENDYMTSVEIIKLCEICSALKVAFVKTSTGYGFNKQENGMYSYRGATAEHLKLMREHSAPQVQIKAAGGVRTLKDLIYVRSLGVSRVGATATAVMMDEAKALLAAGEDLNSLVEEDHQLGSGY